MTKQTPMEKALELVKLYDQKFVGAGSDASICAFIETSTDARGREGVNRETAREAFRAFYGKPVRPYNTKSVDATQEPDTVSEPEDDRPVAGGRIEAPDELRPRLDAGRYVLTSAQNNTFVHPEVWNTLLNFAEHNAAKIMVAKYRYNKSGFQNLSSDSDDELWYAKELEPYFYCKQAKIANDLVWCGEADILPTAALPLNGYHSYTGTNSAIIPHAKMQMQSLATMKHDPAKMLYTTGTVTMRNYIQRRAGQVAEHHHVYGALFVEVDDRGEWFVRQLNFSDDGLLFDLDLAYTGMSIVPAENFGQPIINLGDSHVEKIDTIAFTAALNMISDLNPEVVLVHDLIDFETRNHHNIKDPLFIHGTWVTGSSIEQQFDLAVQHLVAIRNKTKAKIVSVRSNHDQAIETWLRGDHRYDAPNVRFWHETVAWYLRRQEDGQKPDTFGYVMRQAIAKRNRLVEQYGTKGLCNVTFLKEDESFIRYDIELGLHGHLGPNGARGNPKAYRQLGRRANTGHTHSCGIVDGIYTAGVLAKLDMGYNKGPSSWSHSCIVTHPNGKRQIVTIKRGKYRA